MGDLVIERCLPSARATEIQDLFRNAGQPEFSTVYENVYRPREPLGLRSWVGLEAGRVVLHISVASEPFSDGVKTLTAGLLGDLMSDEAHRDFWNPLKLVRKMVADVRKDGKPDFLLTSFVAAAEGVFKAAGFRQFAQLKRHVLPLTWPYPLLRRLWHREPRPDLTVIPFADIGAASFLRGVDSPGSFRPIATREFFTTRMPRTDYAAGTWLLAGPPESPDAIVLVSPKPMGELVVADILWRDVATPLAGTLSSVARWAAREGHRRITLTATEGSRMSAVAQRAGFLVRPGAYRVMALSICPPENIPPPEQWSFTPFVLTSW